MRYNDNRRNDYMSNKSKHLWPLSLATENPGYGRSCFLSSGRLGGFFASSASGLRTEPLAGAVGFTPKSHTYRFIPSEPSISATAYSPGGNGSRGDNFTHPPPSSWTVVETNLSSALTFP